MSRADPRIKCERLQSLPTQLAAEQIGDEVRAGAGGSERAQRSRCIVRETQGHPE